MRRRRCLVFLLGYIGENRMQAMTESNRVEYKRELTDGLEKVVVAFLNARDGGRKCEEG